VQVGHCLASGGLLSEKTKQKITSKSQKHFLFEKNKPTFFFLTTAKGGKN
jgi:hypothetical protein